MTHLFPGPPLLLARAWLSSEKPGCAVEKALAWPTGWRLRHTLGPAHWMISGKYAFFSGSIPGTGPAIARTLQPAIWRILSFFLSLSVSLPPSLPSFLPEELSGGVD